MRLFITGVTAVMVVSMIAFVMSFQACTDTTNEEVVSEDTVEVVDEGTPEATGDVVAEDSTPEPEAEEAAEGEGEGEEESEE